MNALVVQTPRFCGYEVELESEHHERKLGVSADVVAVTTSIVLNFKQ